MKKKILKSLYELQILEDGSSFYNWNQPFKTRIIVKSKDITGHLLWDDTKEPKKDSKNLSDDNELSESESETNPLD